MDLLKTMLKMQRAFQDKYKSKFSFVLYRIASAMQSECGELWKVSGGKWWSKKKYTHKQRVEELADVFHFFLLYMIEESITPEELYDVYSEKLKENYARQERGY